MYIPQLDKRHHCPSRQCLEPDQSRRVSDTRFIFDFNVVMRLMNALTN
jgi:hypothetical protein